MLPPPPLAAPFDLPKPEKGDAEAEEELNLLSGSPPNWSNCFFLLGSERTWKARETTSGR